MQSPRLVAVDSNILLALAEECDDVRDAWELIRSRLKPVMLLVPPTVMEEIGHKAAFDANEKVGRLAAKALREMRPRWMLQAVELRSEQEVIVELAAQKIRDAGLLPYGERNDAHILAEAAVLECALLVSEDSHLHAIEQQELKRLLADLDLKPPLIASPRELLKKFYH